MDQATTGGANVPDPGAGRHSAEFLRIKAQAERGVAAAQHQLGFMYVTGQAVPREQVEDFVAEDGTRVPQYRETLPNGVSYMTLDLSPNSAGDNTREFVVPELLQSNAKPQRLARALSDWLDSPERMRAVQQKFRSLHASLLRDTATLATDAIEKVLAA